MKKIKEMVLPDLDPVYDAWVFSIRDKPFRGWRT